MVKSQMVEITCYIPTRTKTGKAIDNARIQALINKIWPRYRGATHLTGTGYYRPIAGQDEVAECHVLSIVTELTKVAKSKELARLKEQIKTELDQEEVLIKLQEVSVV
jgi:hypothetical protein